MTASAKTSKTLIRKVESGDTLGWEEFYHSYKRLIVTVARSSTYRLTEEDVADLIQIVMLDLWKPGRFAFNASHGVKFRTWFSAIVRYKLIDFIRKKSRRPNYQPLSNDSGDDEIQFPVDVFQQVWDREWLNHLADQALQQLRLEVASTTYQAFDLCELRGSAPKDVSAILGMTVSNINSSTSRCRKRLKSIRKNLQDNF